LYATGSRAAGNVPVRTSAPKIDSVRHAGGPDVYFQPEEAAMAFPFLIEQTGAPDSDPLLEEIRSDIEGKASALELMSDYLDQMRASAGSKPAAFAKLDKLFAAGRAPARLEGHHYGVTLVIRTGDLEAVFGESANVLNLLWGSLLAAHPPWVGKGFTPDTTDAPDGSPVFRGINFFRAARTSALTGLSTAGLGLVLPLVPAPEADRRAYGYDRTGGLFVAKRARSAAPGLDGKEVFQLDYRLESLGNPPPFRYLIDELVEIGEGLYLGPLLFATRRLTEPYDPSLDPAEYGYANFGYFLLMDNRWDKERRRLFAYTEDMEITKHGSIDWANTPKFTSFTFADPPDGNCNDALLGEVQSDKEGTATILDLIRLYVDQLGANPAPDALEFTKLSEMFQRGVAPRYMEGYLHGSVVAFRNEGYVREFGLNAFNMLWPLAREFSPWTGKTFEPIEESRLVRITGGFEEDPDAASWGSNTYADREDNQRPAIEFMRLAGVDMCDASAEEARARGYDVKSFFFIGKPGFSGNPENGRKIVYQLNYRWPELGTMPPDNYCIDEVVQIAEGLYLGELVYATALLEQYDPACPASIYEYRNFGFFLLMDDEWYGRKLEIGFDLTPQER
jgi:hypothetical protein